MKLALSFIRNTRRIALILTAFSFALVLTACMPGLRLKTVPAENHELQGAFTLFLYGCSYPHRIENAVILAPEGGNHPFEMYGPAFEYKVKTGVPAAEALTQADQFLRCSVFYRKSGLRKVLDPSGTAVGYELRPLYSPLDFGRDDVLTITYKLMENGNVMTFIQLDRDIDRMINDHRKRMDEREGRSVK